MARLFVAVDNGVSGTIGAVSEDLDWSIFMHVPTYSAREYMHSKERHMTHIDYDSLKKIFVSLSKIGDLVVVTERPLVNPKLFKATMSGVRAHEILLAVLRSLGIELHDTWDSRSWQKEMLGDFEKGESKPASERAGCLLAPEHSRAIKKHGDADSALMALCLRKRVLEAEKAARKTKET